MTALLSTYAQVLFHLVAAFVLVVSVATMCRLWPQVGVGALVAVLVLGPDMRQPVLSFSVGIGGFEVSPLDLVAVVLVGAAAVQMLTRRTAGSLLLPVALLGALLLVNLLRGVAAYGLQAAVNESRQWFYLGAALAYGAVLPLRDVKRWRQVGVATCGWLVVVAAAGFAATGLQPATAPVLVNGELMDSRPVTAAGALLLADGLLFALAARRRSKLLAGVAALGGSLLLLQHRTVWLAAVAGLVYVMVMALRAGGRARLATVLGLGSVMAATLAAFLTGLVQRSAVAVSAENVAAADNTFAWRVAGWRELLQGHAEPLRLLLGDPFGGGFRRVLAGQLVTVSPHSHYVETFLRFGLVGLGLSAVLVVLAWRAAPAAGAAVEVPAAVLRAVLIVAVVYGITYRLDPLQGLLIGTVLGLATAAPPAAAATVAVPRREPARAGAA